MNKYSHIMNKFRKINNFDINLLREFPGLTEYDGQLFLNDTIDEEWPRKIKNFPELPAKMRFTAIFLCLGGSAHTRVSGNDYIINENDVFMVSLGNIAEKIRISNGFKAISVSIMPDSKLMKFTYGSTRFLRNSLYEPSILTLTAEESKRMVAFFSTVKNIILYESDMFKEEALEGASVMLASYLSARIANKKEDATAQPVVTKWRSNEMLRRFLIKVSQNYTFERSVQFYAKQLYISPKYFAQMIYKESGKHAKDWIRDFVIKDAKTMLKSGNYTVQEVSETLHFANQSFFGKYFKEAVGCSPKMFKEQITSDYSSEGHGSPQEEPHRQA